MLKKWIVLAACVVSGWLLLPSKITLSSTQDALAGFRNNNCVDCHSRARASLQLTTKYAEWHMSLHRDKGIGCEKCHGGDASAKEMVKAHVGMLPPKEVSSSLHAKNLPNTCGTCHKEIANSFVESKHYQNLSSAGLGPSCNTCHAHMASEVIYLPDQAAKLCASCHDSTNALLPKRPEIPGQAEETIQALKRAKFVVSWADRLLEQAQGKKMEVAEAAREMKVVRAMLAESKISWHAFNLGVVRKKADAAFEEGTKVKDELRKKLYPNS
ncbi:MAG TPA: cytochrome c3 family protein [Blastocatellia bacterium]|nr:cytochrome c3 family protein [Blastocatellia bacterium]